MDENLAWKIVYAAALFSLLILGIAYYLISPRETTFYDGDKLTRSAEFKETLVAGRKEGKKVWEFTAGSGWTEKSTARTFLFDVQSGRLYSGGKLVMEGLTAPRVQISRAADMVEAFDQPGTGAKGILKANLNLGRLSSSGKTGQWTRLVADYIRYTPAEKKSEVSGHVLLTMKDGTIAGGLIVIDHDKKTAHISDNVSVKRSNGLIRAAALEYLAEPEQANVPGRLELALKENKIATNIKAGRGTFFMDSNKDISLAGSLEVTQGKKTAVADEGVYSRRQNKLSLQGRTRTVLAKAAALLKETAAGKLRGPEIKDILRSRTVVTADAMAFSTKTGDARAAGNVVVTQKGKEAKADTAVYDDKNETLLLDGNVYMKKGQDWISCRQVLISINKETFEALGVKEAKFKL
jgi:lipopolysaccharide assembly outer membrane protein LptD (OstA)